ncbi:ADQ_G0038370.mRNA.1.CDS.1 [Saccharomyces cerevisiae]|nr:Ste23p [Saccharomyces cerevisiae YJM1387]CAI4643531.1 ADQ_G0038370.mRNA.1.CDS.1 [Saccharomyces cerevisiae]CAI6817889.1 ADQ_G0038370.mRNA.1.CDS.1 [Saccharomyces cerevisiae]
MGVSLLASSSAFVTKPLLTQLVHLSPISLNFTVRRFKPFTCLSRYYTTNPYNMTSNFKTFNLDFLKPDLDERSYRFIELPNKLKALLIQDPEADKAAASLDVNIGAFEDPKNLPGLAHFCEHLLFMGSEKFPDENEYSSYLSKHGGSSNAYTASQNTNYFFEVNHQHLFGALDRFSGFFSCPLFNKDSTDKEINAVNSENKKNLQNDIWRIYQLDKSLTNTKHPYHKFSTGNIETLGTLPKENGLNVRDELLKFHKNFYSANLMKLCILGREDLDTLSNWTYDLFKDVANNGREVPLYAEPIMQPEHLQKIIQVRPVKDLKKLEISFTVPDMEEHWESKPPRILSHLIGHEGSGSLLVHLKKLGWANELSAGGHTVSKGNAFFAVDIDLTDNGLTHYRDVIVLIFQYIEMLKNSLPQKWIFNELQDISNATFKFKQAGSPSSTVSSLAKCLEKDYIPVSRILAMGLLTKYEPDLLTQYTDALVPENSRVTLISRSLETDSAEKWYGTAYKVVDYPADLIKNMKSPGLNPALTLPRPNEFVSTNFKVDKIDGIKPLDEPVLLLSDDVSKLWYKKDDRFWQPRGYIYLSFKLPHTHASIINSMLSTLYTQLANDALKDLQYDAACADLRISFNKTNQGLAITASGFNEKLIILLTRFLQGVNSFEPKKDRFEILKDKTIRHLKNLLYEVPYSQMSNYYNAIINERSWSTAEKLQVFEKLTFEQLINFIPTIYEGVYFETLIHGNIKHEEALEVDSLIKSLIPNNIHNLQVSNNRLRSYLLPKGKTFRYETALKDSRNVNSCIQHVTQLDVYSEDLSALSGLFAQLIHEPCFDTLRTKEQLGYVVFSSSLNNHGTANIRILIQSEHTTPYLEWRINNFYETFGQVLRDMPEEDFEKHKEALCNSLLQKFKNMAEESARYTAAIYLGDYNFTHRQKKAKLVANITKQQMIDFYENYIMSENASKLILHLKSQVENKELNEDELDTAKYPTGQLIEDDGAFKSTLFVAPVRQPMKDFEISAPPKLNNSSESE